MTLGDYLLNTTSANFRNSVANTLNVNSRTFTDYMIPYYDFQASINNMVVYDAAITGWFAMSSEQYKKMREVIESSYDPIENYNMEEETEESTSGESWLTGDTNIITNEVNNYVTNLFNNYSSNSIDSGNTAGHSTSNSSDSRNTRENKSGNDVTAESKNYLTNYARQPFEGNYYDQNKQTVTENSQTNVGYGSSLAFNGNGVSNVATNDNSSYSSNSNVAGISNVTGSGDAQVDTTVYNNTSIVNDWNVNVNTTHKRHGNVGVTTTQQMIEAELQLRKFLLMDTIKDEIIKRYTIAVY